MRSVVQVSKRSDLARNARARRTDLPLSAAEKAPPSIFRAVLCDKALCSSGAAIQKPPFSTDAVWGSWRGGGGGGVLAAAVLKRNGGWVSWPQLRLLVQQFLGCSVDCND